MSDALKKSNQQCLSMSIKKYQPISYWCFFHISKAMSSTTHINAWCIHLTIHKNGDVGGPIHGPRVFGPGVKLRASLVQRGHKTHPAMPTGPAVEPLNRHPWSTPKKDGWSNKHRKVQGNSASLMFFVPKVSVEDKIVWASTTPNVTTGMRTGYYTRMQLTMCLVIPQWKGINSLNPHWLKIGPPRMI